MIEGNINESYYLCEGLWLDKVHKTLTDEDNEKRKLDINNIEDKILILTREIEKWLLHPMLKLVQDDRENKLSYRPFQNAIFMLYGIFSYIEKIQRYKDGKPYKLGDTESTKILTFGFKNLFKLDEKNTYGTEKIGVILENTRHTMMHFGNIGDNTLLNYDYENNVPVIYIGSNKHLSKIELNPGAMLIKIAEDFETYLQNLKDSSKTELRANFEKVFSAVYHDEISLLSQDKNA